MDITKLFIDNARFVFASDHHLQLAGLAAMTFFAGMASAIIAVRYKIDFLTGFPLWIMRQLARFLQACPHILPILCLIAVFNSLAIGIYMLTGIIPMLPMIVCFLTGMNVGIATLAGGEMLPIPVKPPPPPPEEEPLAEGDSARIISVVITPTGCLRAISFVLVMALELPSLWFAIAMGTTLESWWLADDKTLALTAGIEQRLIAYAVIIVPILIISAALEAIGIVLTFREHTDTPAS
jgi:hypothetical protein